MVAKLGSKKGKFPITIQSGAASVKIYRVRTGTGGAYEAFAIADYGTGKRRLRKFSDLRAAKDEAQRLATALGNQDGKVASLDYRDAASLVRMHEKIDPFEITLEAAAEIFAEAAGLVGVHRIVEACRGFSQRHPAAREQHPLAKTADDYHAAKSNQGGSPRYLQDITSRLGRFVHDHPGKDIGNFTGPLIQTWLDGLQGASGAPLSSQSRRNFATVLSGFFEHCLKRGMIVDNPIRDVERSTIKSHGDPEFYTPEETVKLLAAAPAKLVPALAIALFAGLRTAEVCRLKWSELDFDQEHIALGADKTKTATRRLVPILPNLREWLLPYCGPPEEAIWAETTWSFTRAVTDACETARVRRIENGTRHSFVTYRVAATGDVARTALEAGNSAQVIFRHYRALATNDTAAKYFDVKPTTNSKSPAPFQNNVCLTSRPPGKQNNHP